MPVKGSRLPARFDVRWSRLCSKWFQNPGEKHVNKIGIRRALLFVLATIWFSYDDEPNAAGTTQSAALASPPSATAAEDSQRPALQHRDPRYQLCKSDVLELNFAVTPEFNQTVMVQPDGYVTLLAVGDIHVEGETLPEVTEAIRSAYAKTLHEPIVTVRLKDFNKPYFVVGGEVGHPGKYDLRGDTTVLQAIAVGGGFTEGAKHSQVWLIRQISSEWVQIRKLDLKKMLRSGNLSEDLHLRPGDMLYVPKSDLAKMKPFIPLVTVGTYVPMH